MVTGVHDREICPSEISKPGLATPEFVWIGSGCPIAKRFCLFRGLGYQLERFDPYKLLQSSRGAL